MSVVHGYEETLVRHLSSCSLEEFVLRRLSVICLRVGSAAVASTFTQGKTTATSAELQCFNSFINKLNFAFLKLDQFKI